MLSVSLTTGIACGTDKFCKNWIYTVIYGLGNKQIVCEADKIGFRYYRHNKNPTLFMNILLVGIEMVNTQTLKSQFNQIDHDMQKYFC